MMGKCAICGVETPYFTETYNLVRKKREVYPLCDLHEIIVSDMIEDFIKNKRREHDHL